MPSAARPASGEMASELSHFSGKLAVQQRVLPHYRVAFFDLLASRCRGGLTLFAGEPKQAEAIIPADPPSMARLYPADNRHLLGGPLYLCFQPNIVDWLAETDPQALILEANPRYPSNQGGAAWMRERGRPVLGWGLGTGRARPIWSRFLRLFDALIAYSTQGAQQYVGAGFRPDRVFTAPNAATRPLADHVRKPVSDPPRVLFVGRLQERKRIDLLLRACAAQDPTPDLWIVGDGPARERIEREAQQAFPQAQFLGSQQGPELEITFASADLFVLPGTGGLAVQQAIAHGLPVIVAEADGSQADMVTRENGWLVTAGDLSELTQALNSALGTPEDLPQKGAASHKIATEQVNIDLMVDVFISALGEVSLR